MMRPTFNEMVKTMTTFQSNPSQYVLTMVGDPNDLCGTIFNNFTGGWQAGYILQVAPGDNRFQPT